jgi:hypothetical protein
MRMAFTWNLRIPIFNYFSQQTEKDFYMGTNSKCVSKLSERKIHRGFFAGLWLFPWNKVYRIHPPHSSRWNIEIWNHIPLPALCRFYNKENLIEIVKLFVDKNIDVNWKTNGVWNALLSLCRYYDKENLIHIVRLLIEKNIDVNCKNTNGWNALHFVCRFQPPSRLFDLVQLLVQHKVDKKVKKTSLIWFRFFFCHIHFAVQIFAVSFLRLEIGLFQLDSTGIQNRQSEFWVECARRFWKRKGPNWSQFCSRHKKLQIANGNYEKVTWWRLLDGKTRKKKTQKPKIIVPNSQVLVKQRKLFL